MYAIKKSDKSGDVFSYPMGKLQGVYFQRQGEFPRTQGFHAMSR